ncbi:MAG: YafY family protein, partial [Bacillota bacterium]
PGRPVFYRLWHIHQRIKEGRCPSIADLARELEVSRRTIERDLAYLRDVFGAPIRHEPKCRGYVYTEEGFELPPLTLRQGEIAALMVVARLMSEHRESPLAPVVHNFLSLLDRLLPQEVLVDQAELERVVTFAPSHVLGDPERLAGLMEKIMGAVRDRRRLQLRYYSVSRGEESVRKVDPYNLYFARGGWYLIGHCHERQGIRMFALQRVRDVTVLDEPFVIPPTYSAEEFMRSAWQVFRGDEAVAVRLRFLPPVSRQVAERRWHPTQRVEPQPDGTLLLHLEVAHTPELEGGSCTGASTARSWSPRNCGSRCGSGCRPRRRSTADVAGAACPRPFSQPQPVAVRAVPLSPHLLGVQPETSFSPAAAPVAARRHAARLGARAHGPGRGRRGRAEVQPAGGARRGPMQ